MDENTKSQEVNIVLNRLYTDVVDLMRLLNPEGVTDEMKAKYLLSVVDKWTGLIKGVKSEERNTPVSENKKNTQQESGENGVKVIEVTPPPSENVIAKYTKRPYQEDGEFIFKRCTPKPEDKADLVGKYYKIKIHPDGSCTFSFNNDVELNVDDLTELNGNKTVYFPPEVAIVEGEIKEGSKVTTVEEGTVKQLDEDAKRFVVTSPVKLRIDS